jgi:hypothetical protein
MNTPTRRSSSRPIPAATNAAPLTFHEALKPLIAIPNVWLWVIWIAGILALCAGVAGLALLAQEGRRHRSRAAGAAARAGAPRARSSAGPVQRSQGLFHRGLRRHPRYLEERFNFHAPDRTTEEFLVRTAGNKLVDNRAKAAWANFLANCDLIKFAKYEPTETELRALHAAALRWSTKRNRAGRPPKFNPPSPPPGRQAAP